MIRIISDSTSDLSPEIIKEFDIGILPLHILLGEDEYLDGVNITRDELYKWSDKHETTPKTSAPSMADAIDLFKPILDNGDEIVAFSISGDMSTSANVMRLAADELEATDKISVIDSRNLSTGIGLLVVKAAEMARDGKSREEIIAGIDELIPKVRASFVVDTLTYLHRGGRCSGVAAFFGGALKLHPKIEVEEGKMIVGKKYRGKYSGIVLKYAQDMEEAMKNADPSRVFITHSGIDDKICQSVKDYVEGLGVFEEVIVTNAGGTIASHCGYGTLGVLYIVK